jgi:hypothetical protein
MDERQQKAWEDAVERKKEEARAASEQTRRDGGPPPDDLGSGSQESVTAPGTSQDQPEPQHKSSRHGHVTAENWNQ